MPACNYGEFNDAGCGQAEQLAALEDSGEALRDHLAAEAAATTAAEASIKFLAQEHPNAVGWAADRAELRRRMREAGWLGQADQSVDAATGLLDGRGRAGDDCAGKVQCADEEVGVSSFVKLGLLGKGAVGRAYLVKKLGSNTLCVDVESGTLSALVQQPHLRLLVVGMQ